MMQKLRVSSMAMGAQLCGRAKRWSIDRAGSCFAHPRLLFQMQMSKLILSLGGTQLTHELTEEMTTIGRAPENAIRIDDPSVSSRHAQVNKVGETFHLQDLESTNGTRVNGETITSTALRGGEKIRFGKVEARFEGEAQGEAQPMPAFAQTAARPAETSARP